MIDIIELVINISDNFTKIISTNDIIKNYPILYWGGNGIGDRWANKKFNYSVIYSNKKPKLYSENDNDKIAEKLLDDFIKTNKNNKGIIGIFVHSKRINKKIYNFKFLYYMWNNKDNM